MKWISVKDKMPEKDGRYLVYIVYNSFSDWTGVSSLRNGVFDDKNVTHWMELPSKPIEGV